MNESSTIFALSSGAGMAGIAVIRLSGPQAFAAVRSLTGACPRPPRSAADLPAPRNRGRAGRRSAVGFSGAPQFHRRGCRGVPCPWQPRGHPRRARRARRHCRAEARRTGRVHQAGLPEWPARSGGGRGHWRSRFRRRPKASASLLSIMRWAMPRETIEAWRRDLIAILGRVEAAVDFADEADVARQTVRRCPACGLTT